MHAVYGCLRVKNEHSFAIDASLRQRRQKMLSLLQSTGLSRDRTFYNKQAAHVWCASFDSVDKINQTTISKCRLRLLGCKHCRQSFKPDTDNQLAQNCHAPSSGWNSWQVHNAANESTERCHVRQSRMLSEVQCKEIIVIFHYLASSRKACRIAGCLLLPDHTAQNDRSS